MPSAIDRESHQQVRTRAFNEWIEQVSTTMGRNRGTDTFRCECGDGECTHAIGLTHSEYEAVRAHATRFAIALNHENPCDTVVAEHERYAVVQKLVGRASRLAQRTYGR